MRDKISKFELDIDELSCSRRCVVGKCRHEQQKIILNRLVVDSGAPLKSLSEVITNQLVHACFDASEGHGERFTYLNKLMGGCPPYFNDSVLFRPFTEILSENSRTQKIQESAVSDTDSYSESDTDWISE